MISNKFANTVLSSMYNQEVVRVRSQRLPQKEDSDSGPKPRLWGTQTRGGPKVKWRQTLTDLAFHLLSVLLDFLLDLICQLIQLTLCELQQLTFLLELLLSQFPAIRHHVT